MSNEDNKVDNKRQAYRKETIRPGEGGHLLPSNKYPDGKSPFQKLLEDTHQTNEFNLNQAPQDQRADVQTREAVRSTGSQQERYGPAKEDLSKKSTHERDDDREETAKPGESRDVSTPRGKLADRRVIGRGNSNDREGGGEGGQGGFGAGTGQGRQGQGTPTMPGEVGALQGTNGTVANTIRGRFEMELQAAQSVLKSMEASPPPKPPKDPTIISKAVMDQLVQYCRIVTKTDGDKELDMQLHEEIFKGMKLKVSVSKGKVSATFVARSEEVLNLFNARKADIRQALAEKGIAVGSINVIMV